jgi:hypothetical protein
MWVPAAGYQCGRWRSRFCRVDHGFMVKPLPHVGLVPATF